MSQTRHAYRPAAWLLGVATLGLATAALADPPVATPDTPSDMHVVAKPAVAKPAVDKPAVDKPWVRTSSEDGITTYKREVPGSPIIALLGEGIVAAPIARVASVLLDYSRASEWIDSLEEVRVIRMLGPLEFIEYDHVGTPPVILKDRDFVCRGKIELDLQQQTFTLSMEPTTDPAAPRTSYVRGELRGYWKLKSIDHGRKTQVTAEMHGDPKGSVAKWLVNFFQKGWPRNTLESLREQVAKRDIKIIPQVQAAFDGKPLQFAVKSK
ncbi:MAG TPA: START domain-containing protein [Polyangiales bacterium]